MWWCGGGAAAAAAASASARVGLVAHEGLVAAHAFYGVVPVPAGAAEVAEAGHVAAEHRPWLLVARRAHGVFQGFHFFGLQL